jgi:hypothetical protein
MYPLDYFMSVRTSVKPTTRFSSIFGIFCSNFQLQIIIMLSSSSQFLLRYGSSSVRSCTATTTAGGGSWWLSYRRGMSSTATATSAAAAATSGDVKVRRSTKKAVKNTDQESSTSASVPPKKPNVVRLSELQIDKPYTDEQFARCIRPYYEQQLPVKFSTQHNSFPYNSTASAKWLSMDYLLETVGPDYPCDVESMTSSIVRERMTLAFHEYIDYLASAKEHFDLLHNPDFKMKPEEVMYMAQNDIPPSLLPDVSIPGFCSDAQYQIGQGKLYNTMIWIGPRDCASRLHYDPLDNMFLQILGTKRVHLIEPSISTDLIYVDTSVYQQHNMSNIPYFDEELELLSKDPNAEKQWKTKQVSVVESEYPNLVQIPTIYETIMYPGDLLFIPSKWWHAVRSLEYSISVNAWWR